MNHWREGWALTFLQSFLQIASGVVITWRAFEKPSDFFFNPNPSPWPVSRAWQDVWSTHLLPLLSDSSKGLLSVLRMAMLVSTWKHCTSFLPENHSYGSQHAGLFLAFKSQLNLISSERIFSITQSELYHQPLSIIFDKTCIHLSSPDLFFCCCCCSFVRI